MMLSLFILVFLGSLNLNIGHVAAENTPAKGKKKMSLMAKLGIKEKKEAFWKKEREEGFFDKQISNARAECINGKATSGGNEYPCNNVDLLAHLSLTNLGCSFGNDVWGWTDGLNNEYVVAGCSDRTVFVDITDAINPVVLGYLKSHNSIDSSWRDMKVYNGHAYIGSEATGHGLQIFDLSELSQTSAAAKTMDTKYKIEKNGILFYNMNVEFEETAHYNGFGNSHNIIINEQSGWLYAVGTGTCDGGLHMLDISNPTQPTFGGCHDSDGYTHDAECVNYAGPDTTHQGKEICFCYNEDHLQIVDVSDKSNIKFISRSTYPSIGYTHQGWLNEGQTHILLDDETDEYYNNPQQQTRTILMDVEDLDSPTYEGVYSSSERAIDHNQYTLNGRTYQANYDSGLRVLDISGVDANGANSISEQGFFKLDNSNNGPVFRGAWSNFPYFSSGTIALQTVEQGLFLLDFLEETRPPSPTPDPVESPTPPPLQLLPAFDITENTNDAQQNTVDQSMRICNGADIELSLCTGGSTCGGDTFFRLIDEETGTEIGINDDACDRCSAIRKTFTIADDGCKVYELRQGCWGDFICSGQTEIVTHQGTAPVLLNDETAPPSAAPVVTETKVKCRTLRNYKSKEKYKVNKIVVYSSRKYKAIKSSKGKNPATWSTKPNPNDNKWENMGVCHCKDLKNWKRSTDYPADHVVMFEKYRYKSTVPVKGGKNPKRSNKWEKIGSC